MRRSKQRKNQATDAGRSPVASSDSLQVDGYADLTVIGHGATATVYRAQQVEFDRRVALKVLNVDVSNRKAQRRFQRERELNGRLSDHPNVVTVLDAGFVDGRYPYLAMEHFERGSLTDLLARQGPLDVDAVLHMGVRIAGALESAHAVGVLHRDVKPQNILLSRFGEPALADFGIATVLELDHSLTAALTPVHAAPEILEGSEPSVHADVYALGSSLYTLLAGSPPFAGPTSEGMLAQLLRITTSDLPSLARSDIPDRLIEALRRAMAKQPEARFTSAEAFGRELQAIQSELGVSVTALPVEQYREPGAERSAAPADAAIDERAERGAGQAPTSAAPSAWPPPDRPAPPGEDGGDVEESPRDEVPWERTGAGAEGTPGPPVAQPNDDHPEPLSTSSSADANSPADDPWVQRPAGHDQSDMTIGQQLDTPTIAARQRHPAMETPRPPRRQWPIVAGAGLVAALAGAAVVYFLVRPGDDGSTGAEPPTTEMSATTSSVPGSTAVPRRLSELAPTDVVATVDEGVVLVRWTSNAGDDAYHVVSIDPRPTDALPAVPAEVGESSVVIDSVDASAPACFQARAVLGTDERGDAVTADADWVCINGGTPPATTSSTVPDPG